MDRQIIGISENEFSKIMKMPVKSHLDYPNYHSLMKKLKFPIKFATNLGIIPYTFYEKYIK